MLSVPVLDKIYSRPELQQGRDSLDVGELLQSHGSHLYDEVSWLSGVSCSCLEAEGRLRRAHEQAQWRWACTLLGWCLSPHAALTL